LVIAVQIAVTAKHPSAHYLLPSLVITGLMNAAVVALLQRPEAGRGRIFLGALVLLVVGYGLNLNYLRMRASVGNARRYRDTQVRLIKELDSTLRECQRVGYYRSSLPEYALAFGDYWSGEVHHEELKRMYPKALFYEIGRKCFYSFDGDVPDSEILGRLKQGECIVMCGPSFDRPPYKGLYGAELNLEPIVDTEFGGIYRLVGITR